MEEKNMILSIFEMQNMILHERNDFKIDSQHYNSRFTCLQLFPYVTDRSEMV